MKKKIYYKDYEIYNLNLNTFNFLKNKNIFIFLNPHSIVCSNYDIDFQKLIKRSKNLIDGVGLQLFLFFKYFRIFGRNTGWDVSNFILRKYKAKKFFFLGSSRENLKKIKIILNKKMNIKNVKYFAPPFSNYISNYPNDKIIAKINQFKPDFVFVGLTAPKQEKWIYLNHKKINCKNFLAVGAVFDYLSGKVLQPNFFVRKLGLEWLHRLILQPKKILIRIFSSSMFFFYLSVFKDKFFSKNQFEICKSFNEELKKYKSKSAICAMNLAYFAYFSSGIIRFNKNFKLWPDGIFIKILFLNLEKIPGRNLIKNLKIPKFYKRIVVYGNLDTRGKNYLEKKFKIPVINKTIPYVTIKEVANYAEKNNYGDLSIITLPTPKQEILAESLLKKNKYCKILCIGGAISIISGKEKECPEIFYKCGLEFLWRLKYEPFRRSLRLMDTFFKSLLSLIKFNKKKFLIKC